MNHSRVMALLIAGGLVCGGFAAFAADNTTPAEAKPAAAKPAEATPGEVKPAEVKPAEVKPAEVKPAEVKPADAKSTEAKPAEAKPTEVKPIEVKPVEAKPAETKPAEVKPAETKPVEAKPEEKPTETKTEAEVKSAETKPAEVKPAEDPFSAIPPVLAEIGDQKITKDMVVAQLISNLPGGQLPPGVSADLIKRMLPNLAKGIVMQKILELELAKAGIKPSEEMVRTKLNEQIKKMDKEQFAIITQQLQMQGVTLDQFIDERAKDSEFQKQMAGQSYLEDKVLKNVKIDKTIAPDAAQKFYEANKEQFKVEADKPDQLRASHILIASDGKDAEADRKAKEKAEQLIKILQEKPGEFEAIAKDNSSDGSRESGGDLGVFDKGRMVPEFEKAVLALKEGEITSAPVKTQFGYHIIRRNSLKTQVEIEPFEKAKAKIESYLKWQKDMEEQQAQQKALMEYFGRLEKEYKVKYLVEIPAEPAL